MAYRDLAADLLSGDLSRTSFGGWSLSPPHRRELLRVYASAMDHQVHLAACKVAATTSEARTSQSALPPGIVDRGRKVGFPETDGGLGSVVRHFSR